MKTLMISSCVSDGGLYRYTLTEDGTLRLCGFIPADRPMYAVLQQEILYVLEREADKTSHVSGLRTFAVLPDGTAREINTRQSTLGVCAAHLCLKNNVVYIVNYLSGSVVRMPDKVVLHKGSSAHPTRQEAPHPHFITTTLDGYLLVADLGTDKIYSYDADLNLFCETTLRPGSGPRHLVFSTNGRCVFCANELSSTVSMYHYDAGKLVFMDEQSTLPEGYTGENTAAAIRYKNGHVYVSNRGHDSIVCLCVEQEHLVPRQFLPTFGEGPRDFDIIGNHVVCANEISNSVTVVQVESGKLLYKTQLPHPLCVTVFPENKNGAEFTAKA